MKFQTLVIGFGNISRNFLRVLAAKQEELSKFYDLEISVVGIVEGRDGAFHSAYNPDGLDLQELIRIKESGLRVSTYEGKGSNHSPLELIRETNANLLVEATPTNIDNGEPAVTYVKTALNNSMFVATANKGPLIFQMRELTNLAHSKGVQFRYSAAVAGALPIINTGMYSLAGCNVLSITGILNGTTNHILTEMRKKGIAFEDALEEAQRLGIAEKDPRLDVEGYDTAFKILIAANSIMGTDAKLSDVIIRGIQNVTLADTKSAESRGCRIRLVGKATMEGGVLRLTVEPTEVSSDDVLYAVDGLGKAVVFDTDMLGQIVLSGGKSNPYFSAGAIVRDIVNMSQFHK